MNKVNISWNDFSEDCALVSKAIIDANKRSFGNYDCIIGIAKGGCVPATMLAYSLGIETFKTVQIKSYTDYQSGTPRFKSGSLSLFDSITKYKKILVVDDLVDTGKTLQAFMDAYAYISKAVDLPHIDTACIYSKPQSEFTPTFSGTRVPNDTWLNFPWEY